MDEKLLKKYLQYANSDEAFAVLFVKKHLAQAKAHWIDIVDCRRYEMSNDNLHFRFVIGGLYRRKLQPQYPSKAGYTTADGKFDERGYYLMARAITWETAHRDIEQQKLKRVGERRFKIVGVSYLKSRGANDFFHEDAPPEIWALADDLSDRTNPLWDKAMRYVNESEFVYEIKQIRIAESSA